jgi:general secretion pathway protein F
MPVFSYRALDGQGKAAKGVTQADSAQQARRKLRAMGLFPTEIEETQTHPSSAAGSVARRWSSSRRVRPALLAETTRQLHTLLGAGIPLVEALAAIHEQTDHPAFAQVLALVREEVTQGRTLADALAGHPDAFPVSFIHLIRAGEVSGALDEVLGRLADDLERRAERMARFQAALAYPLFMVVVGTGVLAFLFAFIIPTLTGLFESLDAALPWPTRLLLGLTDLVRGYWWLVPPALAGIWLLAKRQLARAPQYRRMERLLFRVPVLGSLARKMLLGRTFRGLAVMVAGGVPLTEALGITALGLGRSNYAEALTQAAALVGQGRPLAEALGAADLFPAVTRRLVAVGEKSGALAEMLARAAKGIEDQTDRALTALTALVEPVIILAMGLAVGFVVLAVLLPIFDLSTLVR